MRNSSKLKRVLVVIHGATGDLALRKLFLALYQLYERYGDGIEIDIWGTGSLPASSTANFQEEFRTTIHSRHPGKYQWGIWERFKNRIELIPGRCTSEGDFKPFAEKFRAYRKAYPEAGTLVFLSLHPEHFLPTVENYRKFNLIQKSDREPVVGWTRFLVEKPFAMTVEAGEKLYRALLSLVPTESAFAMDHYMFKPMVHGILPYRFANTITEPRHNAAYVDKIRIRSLESVGGENRSAYVGATQDMIAAHLLLIYALTRIGQPDEHLTVENLHQRLVGSMTELSQPGVIVGLELGRYTAGSGCRIINGQQCTDSVPGYLEEGGNPQIETAACLTIRPPGTRWKGQTEWKLITGKRTSLYKRIDWRTGFRPPPHSLFQAGIYGLKNGRNAVVPNELNYYIEAERPKSVNDHWEVERFCGTKRRMMAPAVDQAFGLVPNDEESLRPLGTSDGYFELFEEMIVPDRMVIKRSLLLRNDAPVADELVPEIVSTQSLCLLPVTFQLYALKAIEPLLREARSKPDRWKEYPAFTCPWS